jgi:hypothetical protein
MGHGLAGRTSPRHTEDVQAAHCSKEEVLAWTLLARCGGMGLVVRDDTALWQMETGFLNCANIWTQDEEAYSGTVVVHCGGPRDLALLNASGLFPDTTGCLCGKTFSACVSINLTRRFGIEELEY